MENTGGNTNYHARSGKTIEEIYQKKTQLEHILLRPDTYVGSCEHQLEEKWVFDVATEDKPAEMNYRRIDYVPALYKIFDEILVNAADHLIRDPKGMNTIEVNIKPGENMISIYNNGAGLPVCIHKEHKVHIPEMLFGHLLTSDNYNDNEKKVVGGRNGFGAKLTNVFSTKFHLETIDSNVKKYYSQIFESNMSIINPPEIKTSKQSPFTRITFWPDLSKFGMEVLDADMVAMMTKRVFDIAGTTSDSCKVYFNGKRLAVNNFYDYIKVYLKTEEPVHEVCSDRWEIAFAISPEEQFRQVSFVNSICTTKGGTHVTHVTDQLVETLMKKVKAKNKGGMDIKPAHIRNHLWVFIKSLVENPAFDSQTKDTLTTKQARFGSKCEISDQFVNKVVKSGVIEQIIMWAKAKEQVSLKKLKNSANVQRVIGVAKLEDANEAGTKNGHMCTLILTEGDSAKTLAVAGLSIIGRDYYGVFPLRGKVLNVRDAPHKVVTGNAEIQNILKIVGLVPNKEYLTLAQLRYGSIMIMTDQDYDGSHIKGLLINFFDHWWPKLLEDHPGFLKEFITPIVKATKKNAKNSVSFFTIPEYDTWKDAHKNAEKDWLIKYYKGLGTSTTKEAKEYFAAIDQHRVEFVWDSDSKENIDLAFNKKRADDRKNWINSYDDGVFVDTSNYKLNYSDFINKELVLFSKYNVQRAIPSVVDGFKPTQRKILFASFKRKLTSDVKVAQLVGYISEKAAYHHGEVSLENAIVNMAQSFVGSNNINLLVPSGQFGTRLAGGSDAASSRYIYTRLCVYTRNIFIDADDHILNYQNEEGQWIEPVWYCPIIPMILVNGADGIGTGWATHVPNYNPMDIIANLRRALRNEPMTRMQPWYKGFLGTIIPAEKEVGKYDARGLFEKKGENSMEITELPIKKWTTDYKENVLQAMLPNAPIKKDDKGNVIAQKDPLLEDYREYHTESTVHFILKMSSEQMARAEAEGVEKAFRLKSSVNETNMVLFDVYGKIRKYDTANEILDDFFDIRLKMYHKRKEYLVDKLKRERLILDEKVRFILLVINEQLELRKRKKADLIKDLQNLNFKPWSEIQKGNLSTLKTGSAEKSPDEGEEQGEDENAEVKKESKGDYDYLVGMPMWNLTWEKVEEMKKLLHKKMDELDTLVGTSVETMWDRDLVNLQEALSKAWAQEEADEKKSFDDAMKKLKGGGGGGSGGDAPGTKKGKGRGKGAAKLNLRGGDDLGTSISARVRQKAIFEEFSNPVGVVNLIDRPKPEYLLPAKSSASRAAPTNVEIKEIHLDDPDDSRGPMAVGPEVGSAAPEGAPAKKPRRAVKTRAAKKDEQDVSHVEQHVAPVKPPEPPVDESNMSLLQRLLSRQKTRTENLSDISIRKPSTTSHTVLDSGTNDLFGFTSGAIDLTKPYRFDLDEDCLMLPSISTSTAPAASSSSEPPRHPVPSGSTIDIPDTQPPPKPRNPSGRPGRGRKRPMLDLDLDED